MSTLSTAHFEEQPLSQKALSKSQEKTCQP